MANIIVPKVFGQEKYPFLELCVDKAQAYKVCCAICAALEKSFQFDAKHMGKGFAEKIETQHEVRRRTNILCKWFGILRNECSYSTSRALDTLPLALRTELNGGDFEPPKAEGSYSQAALQGET